MEIRYVKPFKEQVHELSAVETEREVMDLQGKSILVTGASGSIGQQVIYELVRKGIRPIAHVRDGSDTSFIDAAGLEKREADLRNRPDLDRLVAGIDAVIHCAAWVDFRKDKLTQFTGINTFGATYLYHAATKAKVTRFLHVSTIAAIGGRPRQNGDTSILFTESLNEHWSFNLDHVKIPYIMTKHAAEQELLAMAAAGGPELVIVNPSIVLSPSITGDNRRRAADRINGLVMPDFPNLMNLVDLRDVAPGIIAALERGRPNERYILAGDNITGREFALAVSVLVGKAPHLLWLPNWVYRIIARVAYSFSVLTGRGEIRLYPDLVKLLDYDWAFTSLKARHELGYQTRSVHTTLKDLLNNNFTGTYLKPENSLVPDSKTKSRV